MAKKYLSLTEASEVLQVDPEELKRLREEGKIRGFADRGNWKFRSEDVEELARSRQADSDPDVPILADDDFGAGLEAPSQSDVTLSASAEMDAMASVLGGDDDDLADDPTIIRGKNEDLSRSDSDVRLIVDDSISLADSDPELSIVDGSDSDVTLAPHSDSDVRLAGESGSLAGSGLLVGSVGEMDALPLDGSSSDVKLVPPTSDSDIRLTEDDSDSDVQLVDTESSQDIELQPAGIDSDSDVRLSSHELEITSPDSDSDVKLVDPSNAEVPVNELGTEPDVEMVQEQKSDSDVVLPTSDDAVAAIDGGSASDVVLPTDDTDSGISLEFDDDDMDDSASVLLGADDSGITLEGSSGLLMAGESGISLEGPADSGISLEMDDEEGISLAMPSDIQGADDSGIALEAVGESGLSLEGDSGIALSGAESGVDLDGTAAEMEAFDMDDSVDEVPATQFEIPSEGDSNFDLDMGDDTGEFDIDDVDATAEFDMSDSLGDDMTAEFDLDDSDMSDVSEFDSLDAASVADIDLLEGDDAFGDESFESGAAGASFGAPAAMGGRAARVEEDWPTWAVATSAVAMVTMLLAAVLSFDLLTNIYSWNSSEPLGGVIIKTLFG